MFQEMGFDDFAKELEGLGDVDKYAPEILTAAAPVLEKELSSQVRKEANRGYATGELAGSIKAGKPSQNKYGYYVSVSATGKDRKGVRNNEKLAYLNYGTSRQSARPVIAQAISKSEKEVLETMQKKFVEVTGK